MNKFKHILSLFGIFLFANNYAQLNNFDLSKYKLPDLERRKLETNFHFSGNNISHKRTNSYSSISEQAYSGFSNYVSLDYYYFLNNEKIQRTLESGLNFSSGFSRQKIDGDITNKQSDFEPYVYLKRENRRYYRADKFIETNIEFNYQYEKDTEFDVTYNGNKWEYNTRNHTLFASIPLKFGKGRIEPIQDARHAVYIFNELSKVNRSSSDKSDNEIIELAELISKLKNKRFFDFRLRKIEEIETIDSLFNSKRYVNKTDATYFTTLNDIWSYGNQPYRSSGKRVSFVIYPGYYYYNYYYKIDGSSNDPDKFNINAFSIDGGVELRHEKPINLFWQNSVSFEGLAGIVEAREDIEGNPEENKIRIPGVQVNYFQTFSYIPNTRTDYNVTYSFQYAKLFDKSDADNNIDGVDADAGKVAISFNANYYISPRFRLNASSSYNYIWQGRDNDVYISFPEGLRSNIDIRNIYTYGNNYYGTFFKKNRYFYFSIRLIYSIF